jgi:crotonobetainyl-CoA:carnitine CoA-transferase CaiB-like acyl-CoA transferase
LDQRDMRSLANPIRIDGERVCRRAGPKLGENTEEILRELGERAADVVALRAAKAI